MPKESTRDAGDRGELIAKEYLEAIGFGILEMNYRFGRGEIDIIAKDGEYLVFCEVKTRYNDEFGDPAFAVTEAKQQQIRKVARGYLFEHGIDEQSCRFDVVAIRMEGNAPDINYFKNAF